jgi:hypothetical protein
MRPDRPRGLGAVVGQEPTKSQVQILPAPPQISEKHRPAETIRDILEEFELEKAQISGRQQGRVLLGYFDSEKHVTFSSNLPETPFLFVGLCQTTRTTFKVQTQTDVRKNGCALSG